MILFNVAVQAWILTLTVLQTGEVQTAATNVEVHDVGVSVTSLRYVAATREAEGDAAVSEQDTRNQTRGP